MALKVALAEFGAMETLAGIEMLPVDVNPTLAPTATGLLNVTVHTDTAPGAREDGLQEVPLRTEIVALAVAPDATIEMGPPAGDVPRALDTPTMVELAPAAKVTDTAATVPLGMRFALSPLAKQVEPDAEATQLSVLAAAVNAGPAVTPKLATEPAG